MLDKPNYLGAAILDLSKILMYDFWYNYAKPTWGDRVRLIMTDTDSLFVGIETDDVDADVLKRGDHLKYFDHSNYKEDHPMSEEKKAKGVRGYVVKGGIAFDDYVNCMKDPGKRHMVERNGLRSYHQTMYCLCYHQTMYRLCNIRL
ncbi:Hypothetical predicted protein [Paramuricea clavata]|uniref:Uncharacterized protein n=1 Tax=Paramuricea clavata TaxID=317549 RepID=A0A7D9JXC9_PARCT|nr:Hypothetical predicted protein [Paramuricea clavata]